MSHISKPLVNMTTLTTVIMPQIDKHIDI
jgi:hypothetical protein